MNYAKDMPISKSDAYLMGMFSTLHYLIDTLEEILEQSPSGRDPGGVGRRTRPVRRCF